MACGVSLDPAAMRAVYTLGLHGGSSRPSEMADSLQLTRPSTSKLIARLGDAGLVRSAPDPSDGRSSIVALTASGQEVFDRLSTAGEQMILHSLSAWPATDTAQLAALVGRFVDGLVSEQALAAIEARSHAAPHDQTGTPS